VIGSGVARWIAAGVFGLVVAGPLEAQEFPSRTVKIVMGFGLGGLGDIAGRAIGEVMSKSIGQPVIVENMPGAGGATAALAVARAAPDGHAMLWVSSQGDKKKSGIFLAIVTLRRCSSDDL